MNMTFRQLRLVLALADTGSISAAARATHVTQPTASMQLREAAKFMGIDLLDHVIVGHPTDDPQHRGYYSFREAGMV